MTDTYDYEIHWRNLPYDKVLHYLNRMKGRVKKVTITCDGFKQSSPTYNVKITTEEK